MNDSLKVEQQLYNISQAIKLSPEGMKGKKQHYVMISQVIPCIMHLENQLAKNNTVPLAMAADSVRNCSTTSVTTHFTTTIQTRVSTQILRSLFAQSSESSR